MTILPNGRLFADEVAERPTYWLGPEHVEAYGADTKLLVKLLDAGERLFVHAHPHVEWARRHVEGVKHGKAEAWFILTAGKVHLGLKEDLSQDRLLDLVMQQKSKELLDMMHCLQVQPGDTVYVPAGTLHSVGQGILLVEVQEPEDLNILCEWQGCKVDGFKDGHLGLGFPVALTAVDRKGLSGDEVESLRTKNGSLGAVMPLPGKECFEMERFILKEEMLSCRAGFETMAVLSGTLKYTSKVGAVSLDLKQGDTVLVPHGDGDFRLSGQGEVIIVRPPVPHSSTV